MYPIVEKTVITSAAEALKQPTYAASVCSSHNTQPSSSSSSSSSDERVIKESGVHVRAPDQDTPKTTILCHRAQKKLRKLSKSYPVNPEHIDFKNIKRLGGGAFCDVFEVLTNKQIFAMKRLSAEAMACMSTTRVAGAATDLTREATILSMIEHENIIKMHGLSPGSLLEDGAVILDDDKNGFFILLDRLESTLDQKIKHWRNEQKLSRPPSWRVRRKCQQRMDSLMERLEVTHSMARGLQYLHENNIIHCDIKPGNAGFDKDGVLKIFDFGLAAKLRQSEDMIPSGAGTAAYMAPEIHQRQPYGKKVDVFSFAITLWQVCALERRPLYNYGSEERPEMQKWWPVELQELMAKCWSTEPDKRPSFDEIVQCIEKILDRRR